MKSHPRVSRLLVQTDGYKDVSPVLLHNGEIGIYYVNTEALAQDGGEFNKFGNDSQAMIQHAVRMTQEHPTFGEVIEIIAGEVSFHLITKDYAIAGGQRRDWLFSGPVAARLNVPHISIYKDGRVEKVGMDGKVSVPSDLSGFSEIVLVSDLITEGSSAYSVEGGKEHGWIPATRGRRGNIKDLYVVVTRLQRGEEMLAKQEVTVHPFVAIDEEFLRANSKFPDRAVAYQRNPGAWSEDYLREYGALAFADAFNPKTKKDDRAFKFLSRYGQVLRDCGKWGDLEREVRERHGVELK